MSANLSDLRRISWPEFPNVERTINALVDAAKRGRIMPTSSIRANVTTDGTALEVLSRRQPVEKDSLYAYASAELEVTITAGTVHWQDLDFAVDEIAIAVPANSTAFRIWLTLYDDTNAANEFAPTYASIDSGATGWSGYPVQPHSPARLYWPIATVVSGSTSITTLTRNHAGGDIQWLPTPYSFWD